MFFYLLIFLIFLILATQHLFFLTTDFTDFTDICYASVRTKQGRVCGCYQGHQGHQWFSYILFLVDLTTIFLTTDFTDFTDFGYAGLGLWACCPFRASIFVGWVGLVGRVGRERTYRSQASVRRTDSRKRGAGVGGRIRANGERACGGKHPFIRLD